MPRKNQEGTTMTSLTVGKKVPYKTAQMFTLVADVARYPEFVPFWQAVRVKSSTDKHYKAEQILRAGPLRYSFHTDTFLDYPSSISVRSQDTPFRFMFLDWTFVPEPHEKCLVTLHVDFDFRSGTLNTLSGLFSESSIQRIVDAFEKRADALYAKTEANTHA